jgi:hypothetical protein
MILLRHFHIVTIGGGYWGGPLREYQYIILRLQEVHHTGTGTGT